MSKPVIYEQPLNERVRTFLRLEHLFRQTDYTLRGYSMWDSRATLDSIIATLEILGRTDLKTELIKELERQSNKLTALKQVPDIDTAQLEALLGELDECLQTLYALSGQFGQHLREHELISTLRQRQSIPGGDCPIDVPMFHLWLQQAAEDRIAQLEDWSASLEIVRKPVGLLLGMIREASNSLSATAPGGFYQQSLDSNLPIQLIRVAIEPESICFAEISAGKHRLTIRFLEPQPGRRPLQVQDDVDFKLTCCTL